MINHCSLIVFPHLSSLLLSAGRFWSWAAVSGWPVSPSVAPAVRTDLCSVTVTPPSCRNWEATCSWTVWLSRRSAWRRWTGRQPQRNKSNGSDRTPSSLQVRVQTLHQFIQFQLCAWNNYTSHSQPWRTGWLNFYILTIWFLLGGADVVYDPDVAGSLVKLLSKILNCSSAEVFICSTIRNQETYGGFKQQLGKRTHYSS